MCQIKLKDSWVIAQLINKPIDRHGRSPWDKSWVFFISYDVCGQRNTLWVGLYDEIDIETCITVFWSIWKVWYSFYTCFSWWETWWKFNEKELLTSLIDSARRPRGNRVNLIKSLLCTIEILLHETRLCKCGWHENDQIRSTLFICKVGLNHQMDIQTKEMWSVNNNNKLSMTRKQGNLTHLM